MPDSTQSYDQSSTPVQLHPADIHNLPDDASLQNVPDFEKPSTANVEVKPGTYVPGSGTIAQTYANATSPNLHPEIAIDDPKAMDQGVMNHEVFHIIQARQLNRTVDANDGDVNGVIDSDHKYVTRPVGPGDHDGSEYDYGGESGLQAMRQKGKSLANLNYEQQAEVLRDYTNKASAARKALPNETPLDKETRLREFDRIQKSYGPFIHQMATMARPGDTIDTTPQAPGPPPAALTGAMKPLPEMGGRTVEVNPKDVHNLPKKATQHRIYKGASGLK